MAILPSSTSIPFIQCAGNSLVPQEKSTPPWLLSGAVNSLLNRDPAQANAFVERLQQVSPDIANRIFHLTWERSGKPMNLGDRFGEEAFFGHWGRSIDLSIKLGILRQVSQETAATNAQTPSVPESQSALVSEEEFNDTNPFQITELAFTIFPYSDARTLQSLACANKPINRCVRAYEERLDLKHLCPNLQILDAKAQEITVNDEPRISKLWIWNHYNEMEPQVEDRGGLTLLTMPQGLTMNRLTAIAEQAGITVVYSIVQELENVPVEQTYVILITNRVFQQSRSKSYARQQELVARHGCVMPTIQEYVALCVLTSKVFQKWLHHGGGLWEFAHSSTHFMGGLLIAISPSRVRLNVDSNHYLPEFVGAGGRRKFSH